MTEPKRLFFMWNRGGYYERDIDFGKPVIACVVGRWKSKLTCVIGYAQELMAGKAVDKAEDKAPSG